MRGRLMNSVVWFIALAAHQSAHSCSLQRDPSCRQWHTRSSLTRRTTTKVRSRQVISHPLCCFITIISFIIIIIIVRFGHWVICGGGCLKRGTHGRHSWMQHDQLCGKLTKSVVLFWPPYTRATKSTVSATKSTVSATNSTATKLNVYDNKVGHNKLSNLHCCRFVAITSNKVDCIGNRLCCRQQTLLPILATVYFQQSRSCWIQLCR